MHRVTRARKGSEPVLHPWVGGGGMGFNVGSSGEQLKPPSSASYSRSQKTDGLAGLEQQEKPVEGSKKLSQ